MYTFVLDKRSLLLLAADVLVIALVLVAGGFLLGIRWDVPTASARTAALGPAPCPPATSSGSSLAALADRIESAAGSLPAFTEMGTEPGALGEAEAAGEAVLEELDPQGSTETPDGEAPAGEPAGETPSGRGAGAPAAPAPAAPSSGVLAPAPVLEPEPAPAPLASRAGMRAAFALQVGAFRQKANSEAIVEALEGRGYQPYVVELTTGRRRILHAVRIGRYADLADATRAAADFRERERMAAIVQPAS